MKAGEIITAIRRKYPEGALVCEITAPPANHDAYFRRGLLDTVIRKHGAGSKKHLALRESMGSHEIADHVPTDWLRGRIPPRRIDALLYSAGKRIAIEVKVSVADFKRDTPEKREPWEIITHQFVYATPAGLLAPAMVPAHCGLWEVDAYGRISITKKAKINPTRSQCLNRSLLTSCIGRPNRTVCRELDIPCRLIQQ